MMDFSVLKGLSIPEGVVTKIEAAGKTLWQLTAGIKNWIRYATEIDLTTLYNGCGYKNGYRLNSSGAEVELASAYHTGYIPVKIGDVIRVSGNRQSWTMGGQYLAFYRVNGESLSLLASVDTPSLIGSYNAQEEAQSDGTYKFMFETNELLNSATMYAKMAYFRVSGNGKGENMIVTVNEEIV